MAELVQTVAEAMKSAYPELVERSGYIQKVVALEEERFRETLEQGTQLLRELIDRTAAAGRSVIAGDEAFRLYDTYGFPLELTEEIARDHGMEVDLAGFQEAMQRQREIARTARGQTGYLDSATDLTNLLDTAGPTEFVGYSALVAETRISQSSPKEKR